VTIDNPRAGVSARGAVAGVLTGGLALGVAQLIAGLISSTSSPVVAVGELSIDFTPPALKNFAIIHFGSHDKGVLVAGILVVLAIFAAGIGVVAVRRLSYGMAGLGVFVMVGLIAALTRPGASATDVLPTLVGGVAAVLALRRLVSAIVPTRPAASPPIARPILPYRSGRPAPGQPGTWRPDLPGTGQRSTDQPGAA
jgi:hypothetical protein